MPRTWIDQGVASFGGMVPFLRDDAPQVFARCKDEALQKAFADASAKAIAAFKALADWLEAQRATQTEDYAIGAELFAAMLAETEGVEVPLDRLLEAGKADLARNLAALDEACKEFAPGRDRKGCMAMMNANRPKGGAVEGARKQLDVLRAFVVEHKLATIPVRRPDPRWTRRRRTRRRISPTSTRPVRMTRACRPRITSRRRTRRGRRPNRTRTRRASPTSCPRPCTRSGPGTSSIPCTRTGPRASSGGCS